MNKLITNTMSIIKMVDDFNKRQEIDWSHWLSAIKIVSTLDPDMRMPLNMEGMALLNLFIKTNGRCEHEVNRFLNDNITWKEIHDISCSIDSCFSVCFSGSKGEPVNERLRALHEQSFDEQEKAFSLSQAMLNRFVDKRVSITSVYPSMHRTIEMREAVMFYLTQVENMSASDLIDVSADLKALDADIEEPFKHVVHWAVETNRILVRLGYSIY